MNLQKVRFYKVALVLAAFATVAQSAWAQGKPKTYDEYLRMTAELQAQREKVLKDMAQNGKAMLDLQGLGDVISSAIPWPTAIDLANKGNDLKAAQDAYRNGDVNTALSKYYDVLSWYVLKFATVGGYEFGPVHDTSKAATQFAMEWQAKVNTDNKLASQLAAIALRQAELDRIADSLPLIDPPPVQSGQQQKKVPPPSRPNALPPPSPVRADQPQLDDAALVNRWLDLGNRAFSNKVEEEAFYR
jgi:hypothetical protein